MPSQAELFKRYYNQNKINARSENLQKVISKYGGEEYLAQPDELKLTNLPENEGFIYNRFNLSTWSIFYKTFVFRMA